MSVSVAGAGGVVGVEEPGQQEQQHQDTQPEWLRNLTKWTSREAENLGCIPFCCVEDLIVTFSKLEIASWLYWINNINNLNTSELSDTDTLWHKSWEQCSSCTSILVAKVTMILFRRAAGTNFSSVDPVSIVVFVTTSSIQNISYFIHSANLIKHYNTVQQEEVICEYFLLSLKNEYVSNSNIFKLTFVSMQGSRWVPAGKTPTHWQLLSLNHLHNLPFIFLTNKWAIRCNPWTFATSQVSLLV